MKLECPYCWQHYEVEKKDLDHEFVCISCEQAFHGRDALILEDRNPLFMRIFAVVALLLIVGLLGSNLWCWRQLQQIQKTGEARNATNSSSLAPIFTTIDATREDLARFDGRQLETEKRLAEQGNVLKDLQKQLVQLDANTRQLTALNKTVTELEQRLEKIRKSGELNDQQLKILVKALADLRYQLNSYNLSNRLGELEKFAANNEVAPLIRRLDRLEKTPDSTRN